MVEKIGIRAGIDRVKVHPHMLRHTNITMLLEKGMPLEKVQAHAGHAKISTTQIYTHLTYKVVSKSYQDVIGAV
jgi:integrase/recombinase XerD